MMKGILGNTDLSLFFFFSSEPYGMILQITKEPRRAGRTLGKAKPTGFKQSLEVPDDAEPGSLEQ